MTFKEAIHTGYRIKPVSWVDDHYWYQKISDTEFTVYKQIYKIESYINELKKYDKNIVDNWIIHPEDQKLIDFNNRLEKLINE